MATIQVNIDKAREMNFPVTGGISSGTVEVNIDLAQEGIYWKISKEPASPGYDEVNSTLTINGVTGLTEYSGNTTGVTDFEIVIPSYTGSTTAWTRYAVECYRGDTKINLGNTPFIIGRRQVAANTVIVDAQNLEKRYIPASGGSNDCSVDVRIDLSQSGYFLVIEPLVSKQSATTLTVNGVDYGFGSFSADTIGVYNFSISYPAWDGSGDTTRSGKRYTDYYIYVKNSQAITTVGDTPIEILYYQYPPTNKNIFLGENAVETMYIGSESATCAYLGSELVWEASSPVPPAPDYSQMPLTIEVLTGGTLEFKAANTGYTKTIEYSLNGGNWTQITSTTSGEKIADVVAGDIVQLRCDGSLVLPTNVGRWNAITGTAYFNVYGNILSLWDSTGFTTTTSLSSGMFANLFQNARVVSAEHLIIPTATTSSIFFQTFRGCSLLTTAPVLPATTLAASAYRNMFYGCSQLNYIKCLATDISASRCTLEWVWGVSATGTFVKNSSMTGWTTGVDGIPSGWNVVDAQI